MMNIALFLFKIYYYYYYYYYCHNTPNTPVEKIILIYAQEVLPILVQARNNTHFGITVLVFREFRGEFLVTKM